MAKKKQTTLKDWEEVDQALRRMGEIDIATNKISGEMTLRINEIKAEAATKAEGLKAERKKIETNVGLFCEDRKEEFAKTRTKDLTFGLVGYRVVTKIVIRSKKACLAAMHALNLTSYVRTKEDPDKEAMEGLDATTLVKIGATRKTSDKLRIEPNLEKLKEAL